MSLGKAICVKSVIMKLEGVGPWTADYGEVDFEHSAEFGCVYSSS